MQTAAPDPSVRSLRTHSSRRRQLHRIPGYRLGNLCLYGATLFVLRERPRGQTAFITSAVLLGLSSFGWQWTYAWTWVIGFGALLAIGGVYLVRRSRASA